MNREELIKDFDKQQLEILLNDLQDIDKFTGFKDGAFKYELGKYQACLLVDCIKKQKEVIDKLSSQIKLYGKYNGEKCTRGFSMMTADFNKLLDILKEVE